MRRAAARCSRWSLVAGGRRGVACGGKKPPVARPTAAAAATGRATDAPAPRPPAPPEPVAEPTVVPPEPVRDDAISSASLDDLNRNSPLKPVFFELRQQRARRRRRRRRSTRTRRVLKQYPTWTVTIEGHCDERGTAEYNLALGERRAVAARAYLVSLGIPADRLRTVSYGKEFPFDPGHDEAAYAKNRRAHFVITAK